MEPCAAGFCSALALGPVAILEVVAEYEDPIDPNKHRLRRRLIPLTRIVERRSNSKSPEENVAGWMKQLDFLSRRLGPDNGMAIATRDLLARELERHGRFAEAVIYREHQFAILESKDGLHASATLVAGNCWAFDLLKLDRNHEAHRVLMRLFDEYVRLDALDSRGARITLSYLDRAIQRLSD